MLSPTENSRIQGLSRLLSDVPALFKADLIFKDFSKKPTKFKYFSSLCEPRDQMAALLKTADHDPQFFINIILHINEIVSQDLEVNITITFNPLRTNGFFLLI